jgi:bifunctional UDP-N-acetylglucosamine pyrophosphorylase / glucosamine-1-phosphate N-acetyltransferase
MKHEITIVVLAAGLGTRMKSRNAKVLHEAGGDTLLNHVIRAALRVAPAERIVVVIGHQAQQVRESVKFPGVRFVEQIEQKGTGHAVLCVRDRVHASHGQLLILNGDGPLLKHTTLKALLEHQIAGNRGGTLLTTEVGDPTGYGRIVRDARGMILAVVEQKAAGPDELRIREINPGVYCFDAALFWRHIGELTSNNPAGEYYLTDMVAILTRHGHPIAPMLIEDETELLGINTRVELAVADKILRGRKAHELMLLGVTIEYPESAAIDVDVEIGQDSVIESNVQLRGQTRIGSNCHIGTGAVLRDCEIADHVTILPYVVADSCSIGANAFVGPFARLRMNAEAGEGTHIGNFVELKKTKLGKGSKANHLAYLGDATIGANVNVGAGTITCNYDGARKHPTTIADGVFVGSNATLVAPLTISERAYIAAGSTITKNVEPDSLALGRAYQVDKAGWARRRRDQNEGSS